MILQPGDKIQISRYCSCGASLRGSVSPAKAVADLHEIWVEAHSGPGHEPTDAKGAAATRRREERQAVSSRKAW